MDERIVKFRVGVMVISTLFIAGILVLLFSDVRSMVSGSYYVHIHFNNAPGVTNGTPVRKNGILIGRVRKVEFAEPEGVNVTVEIRSDVKLYRSEVPQVTGSLLGGDVVIQFVKRSKLPPAEKPPPPAQPGPSTAPAPGPTEQKTSQKTEQKTPRESPDDLIRPDDYIEGSVAPSPVQVITNLEGNLATAIDSLSHAGDEVGKLAGRLNQLLDANDDQFKRIVNSAESSLQAFQKTMGNLDKVIGDEQLRENLKKSFEEMPLLLSDARGTMNSMKVTVESVDRNMRNLEQVTGPLGERGDQIVGNIDRAVKRLDELLSIMSDFGKKLNSGEGSLGRIMRDPSLYQNLDKASRNIAQLTCEMRPIINDARVFMDKVARHPGVIVRDAMRPGAGIK
jgi:phospholipid/cholesterol/gamma-HCH transport system substrate-binding protein